MDTTSDLAAHGLFDARVPRYTSYPTAPVFSSSTGAAFQAECLRTLDPDTPLSVYVHVPFCERLCWFCACRTQGTQTLGPLESYVATLKAELDLVRDLVPDGVRMGRLHLGGGTPTILPPRLIHALVQAIKTAIPPAPDFEFSVEIDPTAVDADKIRALHWEGMSRASIGIQDFAETVQKAIGREQSFETTRDCIDMLRAGGVHSLNADLVYGLPHQTEATLARTVEQVLSLAPDRVALFGYAHVPWMAKRQRLIDEASLPDDRMRHRLFTNVSERLVAAGFEAIGIDHFARPVDTLSMAARGGHLRRNFQGYTDDTCPSLIGLGASSISRYAQGYVQNNASTGAYSAAIAAGGLAGMRGHAFTPEDGLRGRAIEMLMCDFRIDLCELAAVFPDLHRDLDATHRAVAERFARFVDLTPEALTIRRNGQPLTRIIARMYDAYETQGVNFSKAS